MLNLTVAGMLLAALTPQGADFQTDTTLAVPAGIRLSLQTLQGDVVIHTWDRNQVRVQAEHSTRTTIGMDLSASVLRLTPRGRDGMGMGSRVDYELTLPASMGIEISGMGGDVTIEGSKGDVKVNTVEGDIVLKGGGGEVTLVTVNGGIRVDGTRGGRLELQAVSDDIEVTDVQGDVSAQTVSGNLRLRGVDGRRVEAQTVSGDVTFDGVIRPDGSYGLSTHSGDITMAIPEGASAMIRTAIANGDLSASFTLPDSERASRTRQAFRLGGGGASIELETFSGDISLVRPGAIRSRNDKED
jgi:hypothetical protein